MLPIIQLIIAILLVTCILLQQRGSGLGAAFGGSGSVYRTKRGAEKVIFNLTIILAVLFIGLALLNVYLNTQSATDLPTDQAEDSSAEEAESENLPLDSLGGTEDEAKDNTEAPADDESDEAEPKDPFSL